MQIQNIVNTSYPLACTATAIGLLFYGSTESIVRKATIVALMTFPIFANSFQENDDPELQGMSKWIVGTLTFGTIVGIGIGGWLALQSEIIATITALAITIFSNVRIKPQDNMSYALLGVVGVIFTLINVMVAVENYSKS